MDRDLSCLPERKLPVRLKYPHFPALHQLVIWRNLNLVPAERIGAVLGMSAAAVREAAEQMGLTVEEDRTSLWAERGFQTIIRRNWDILPYEQLLQLLDWPPEKLAFILKEDDFLWFKLGCCKPDCAPVRFTPLTEAQQKRTEAIRATMQRYFGSEAPATAQPFDFLRQYGGKSALAGMTARKFDLKMAYSYSALYGDPLLDPEIGSYPDPMFRDYAASGVNAVWMQITLYTLWPWLGKDLPQSAHYEERLANLRKLVARGKKYGVEIILYVNEPRAMPEEFFRTHPDWMGAVQNESDEPALCTSHPEVQKALEDGVFQLFRAVPGLGGMFAITMSENLVHCKSRSSIRRPCPRCAPRPAAELTAELNRILERGMHRAAPEARYIAYSWGWEEWDAEVIPQLPAGSAVMCVSEDGMESDCGGIKGIVSDYSISKVGPGESAKRQWRLARDCGLTAMAKVQLNCSWELSAVPYIPVPDLVEAHLDNLEKAGVKHLMLNWTQGGFPGGNMELLAGRKEELAERKFGAASAVVLNAWSAFSRAFAKFPFHQAGGLYTYPGNYGPMSLLFAQPTFRGATMIGFPYDDLYTWRSRGHFPESVYEEVFRAICEGWQQGLDLLNGIEAEALSEAERRNLEELRDIATVCFCHFRSTLNQIRFVRARRENSIPEELLADEIRLAVTERAILRRDSRIGYEASNHYFFTGNDLAEKVLNCEFLRKSLADQIRRS